MKLFHQRLFHPNNDLEKMKHFLQKAAVSSGPYHYQHIGLLQWELFAERSEYILWADNSNELVGFIRYDDTDFFDFQLFPIELYNSLGEEMLEWIMKKKFKSNLRTSIFENDKEKSQFFAENKFNRGEDPDIYLEFELSNSLEYDLPKGFVIRQLETEKDILKRNPYNPNNEIKYGISNKRHIQILQLPKYGKEVINLIAEDQDGTFVSYCTCWVDEVNKEAFIEPVGTRAEFRGQGLARIVIYEAIKRAINLGIKRIITVPANDHVKTLYERYGFRPRAKAFEWTLIQSP